MLEQHRNRDPPGPQVEARRRALDAEDPGQLAAAVPHGRGDRREPDVPLLPWRRRTLAGAPCSSSSSSRFGLVIVRGVNAASGAAGSSTSPNASITLPTAVAWPTLGRPIWATLCTTDELCAKSTVTASCSPGDGQRRRLARLPHELLQVRPCERPQVEPPEHRVAELDQPQREAIAARLGDVLDVLAPRQGWPAGARPCSR